MMVFEIFQGQLNPIVIGLLRVRQFRFVHVLQQEIVEALKNSLRQVCIFCEPFYNNNILCHYST